MSCDTVRDMAKIIQDEAEPVAPEILASQIERIANAMGALTASKLKFETVVLLVSHASKVGKTDTHNVLVAAINLAKTYLKPKPKQGG